MKNTAYILLAFSTSSLFAQQSYADTSVFISGNAEGSHSNVNVQNEIHSSTTQNSTSNTHTSVHIETNGNVQDYNSDNPDDVHIQSNDGNAKVNITNNMNNNITISPF